MQPHCSMADIREEMGICENEYNHKSPQVSHIFYACVSSSLLPGTSLSQWLLLWSEGIIKVSILVKDMTWPLDLHDPQFNIFPAIH